MKKQFSLIAALFTCVFLVTPNVMAHDIFKDVMKEIYPVKSFSCKACHPDSSDRKIRTSFGDLIHQEMKELNLSEKFAAVEPQGKEAIKEFEKSIVDDFKKAMLIVGKKQLTFDEMINSGLFSGARLDKTKVAEMNAAGEGAAAETGGNEP